jgi:hypothetical protein
MKQEHIPQKVAFNGIKVIDHSAADGSRLDATDSHSVAWRCAKVAVVLGLALSLMMSTSRGAGPTIVALPNAKAGAIHGKVALLALLFDRRDNRMLFDSKGCQVHLVNSGDESIEHAYPCGAWFQPPVGRYLLWLELGSFVSYQSVVYYAGEPFRTAGKVFQKQMFPAGSVQLDKKTSVPVGATFRLLALNTRARFRPFDRKIANANASRQVRVPVGRVIAGVFDSGGRALLLSPP